MSEASHGPTSSRLKAALQALHKLCVPSRGPFITPKQNRIFVVGDCILTEAEIVALHEAGKFTAENAAGLLCELEQRQRLEHASGPAHAERRRSQRGLLRVAVLVKAEMPRGDLLQGEIFTVNVNAHGGLLESPIRMAPGQRMTLTNPQSGKQVACTVVRVEQPPQGSLFTIAFEFAERSPRFWPLPLPPLDWVVGPEPA